ncbi:uncharacterized protein BO88DRAFT_491406 [Aspergillus vadensis CBS 113365]|uniref:Uncharacterized protein n=1 Tax=Aspergillus vadensis (strain CBS 113365 / IMI 142717 / IBT 24658) TaxID=1448311 RepID=A0A319BEU7_ASPVC|nr:hypothetical protein BO88DRAFT_491406 [Aspergillus vadensis CBS 113365]PYH64453.1 hypothetical protein BO88DRAFT_491406 [Aspergillus vadensis CBS 113365]
MSLQENHGRPQRGLSSSIPSRFRTIEPEEIRPQRRIYIDHDSDFSDEEEQINERGNMSEGTTAVSYVIGSDGTKRVEIHSKPLVEALGRATKDSTRRGPADFFTESEPFPTLFYHMEDIREEIAKSDDQDASLDLEALEQVAAEMAPWWHKACAETFESGFVSYDMLWKLFQTGESVLHEDEIGCLWQFIFIDITYHSAQRQRRRPLKEQCAAFTVWGLNTMDVAFQSRIQIGISFREMTPATRAQIWERLLSLNGRDKMIGPSAVQDVKHRLGKFQLNGRQIRNVLNVADSLAFNEYGVPGKLKYRHIQEAVETAMEFQKMLVESKKRMKNEQTVWAMYRGDNDFSI